MLPTAPERPPSARRGSLVTALLAVAVFGGLIGFAADRWFTSTSVPNLPLVAEAAPTPTVGSLPRVGSVAQATADPTEQAIQQVIQRGDDEQARAIAANNPSLMADTATAEFYQQQVQVNRDLTTNGVTVIKLVGIEWGPISVSGTSATATAWETWTTTYADGTTDQSRDRNVYTLVLDHGTWKVSADAHPDDPSASGAPGSGASGAAGSAGPGGPSGSISPTPGAAGAAGSVSPSAGRRPGGASQPPQPSQPSQPRQPRGQRGQDVSANWSGYAVSNGGPYTAVSGTWSVPQFSPGSQAGADAAWVGIGGVDTTDLIQAGTQQTVSGSGSTQYQAWVETLPQASHPVPLAIHPGDSIRVTITQQPQAQDEWLIAFSNATTGQQYQVTEHYASSRSSAEWIEEAPSSMRGRQLPLDDFGTVSFSAGSATRNGQPVTIAASGAQAITMVDGNGQPLAKPSRLGSDGASFSVSRS